MKKNILLVVLMILPNVVFGQSYVGYYKAQFITTTISKEKINVEFEVREGGAVVGKVTGVRTVAALNGQIDSYGNLEAKSQSENNTTYTLKTNMSWGNGRITLNSKFEENSAGKTGFSQAVMQSTYSKIDKYNSNQSLTYSDNRKSEITIEQPNPLFNKEFTVSDAKFVVVKEDFVSVYHVEMQVEGEGKKQAFYFSVSKIPDSGKNKWKIENIQFVRYIEKIEKEDKLNNFHSDYDVWKKNREVSGGEIELLSSDARQMVFRITDLKIKNMYNTDTATINGIVYAEIKK